MTTTTRKTRKPETLTEARRRETMRGRYPDAGLCDRCAAQAAWGHQLGFSLVDPPCVGCSNIVATFPVSKHNGWRAAQGGRVADTLDAA